MQILGYNYQISRVDDYEHMGAVLPGGQKIKLAANISPEAELSTLLHEVLEALKYHLDLHMNHRTLCALEAGLFQVLTQNGVDLTPLLPEKLYLELGQESYSVTSSFTLKETT